jgi:hypothetical protein
VADGADQRWAAAHATPDVQAKDVMLSSGARHGAAVATVRGEAEHCVEVEEKGARDNAGIAKEETELHGSAGGEAAGLIVSDISSEDSSIIDLGGVVTKDPLDEEYGYPLVGCELLIKE